MTAILFGEYARGAGIKATYLELYVHNRQWEALEKIDVAVDLAAENAQCEIKAMAESARRSIGQMTRRDVFWRRAGSIYHVLYLKSLEERLK